VPVVFDSTSANTPGHGCGLRVESGGRFDMRRGTISSNEAGSFGGGVRVSAGGSLTITVTEGESATATITIPAAQIGTIEAALNDAKSKVIAARLEPLIIIEGIRFYVEEGIDAEPLKAELAITDSLYLLTPFVSSWIRTHTGGLQITLAANLKAVIRSDGSEGNIWDDLIEGTRYVMELQAVTANISIRCRNR